MTKLNEKSPFRPKYLYEVSHVSLWNTYHEYLLNKSEFDYYVHSIYVKCWVKSVNGVHVYIYHSGYVIPRMEFSVMILWQKPLFTRSYCTNGSKCHPSKHLTMPLWICWNIYLAKENICSFCRKENAISFFFRMWYNRIRHPNFTCIKNTTDATWQSVTAHLSETHEFDIFCWFRVAQS